MHQVTIEHGTSLRLSGRDRNTILKRLGLLSVPLSLFSVLVVTSLNPVGDFRSPLFLLVLNSVFISCTCLLLSFFAARSFVRIGRASLLLVGCGTLMFAIGSFASG